VVVIRVYGGNIDVKLRNVAIFLIDGRNQTLSTAHFVHDLHTNRQLYMSALNGSRNRNMFKMISYGIVAAIDCSGSVSSCNPANRGVRCIGVTDVSRELGIDGPS
jgi:hypothetical protein